MIKNLIKMIKKKVNNHVYILIDLDLQKASLVTM